MSDHTEPTAWAVSLGMETWGFSLRMRNPNDERGEVLTVSAGFRGEDLQVWAGPHLHLDADGAITLGRILETAGRLVRDEGLGFDAALIRAANAVDASKGAS